MHARLFTPAVWLCLVFGVAGCNSKPKGGAVAEEPAAEAPAEPPLRTEPVAGIPAATLNAWEGRGGKFGWHGRKKGGRLTFADDQTLLVDPVPAFAFEPPAEDAALKDLPVIERPFALVLCGKGFTDAGLALLPTHRHMVSLHMRVAAMTDAGLNRDSFENRSFRSTAGG